MPNVTLKFVLDQSLKLISFSSEARSETDPDI